MLWFLGRGNGGWEGRGVGCHKVTEKTEQHKRDTQSTGTGGGGLGASVKH